MKNFLENNSASINQFLFKDEKTGVELWLKREDLLHPFVSGNKFRKLKYNLIEAKEKGYRCFTEQYHLKRGYCCKSGCRHCPYGYDKATDTFKKKKDN